MPLATATITFDISDQLGTDYDVRRGIRGWVDTNIPGDTIVDTDGNKVRLGSGKVTFADDGTGSFTVWVPGVGSNPASWQTYLHVEYVPSGFPSSRGNSSARQTRTFGPFTITGNADLADLIEEQEVPPEYAGQVVAQMEALVSQQESLAAIDDTDTAVAYAMEFGTETPGYLSATIAAAQPVVVTSPQGLNRWRAALGRAMFERAVLNINGDSISAGAYANDTADADAPAMLKWAQRGWVGQLRNLFASTYGDSGEGWIGFNGDEGRWTYTGTSSTSAAGPISSGRTFTAGAKADAADLGPFDTIDYIGYHGTSVPPPSLFVDGVDETPTLMTDAQRTLTVGASAWANRANTTLAHGTEGGEDTLVATSAASGNMSFQTPITVGNGLPCAPGDKFIVGADIKSTASSRAWRAGLTFYNAAGASITEATTVDATASTVGSWQTKSNLVTAPANTAYAAMIVRIDSAGAASEVHTLRRIRAIPVTAHTGAGGATMWRASRTGLTDTTHDVTVAGAATGSALCGGIVLRSGDAGVMVSRIAKSGTTSKEHVGADQSASTQTNMLLTNFELQPADLHVFALGANDVAKQTEQSITSALFKTYLSTMTDRVTALGGCSLLIAGPRYSTETTPETQAAFYAAMREIAEEDPHVAFVDIGAGQWVDNDTADALGFIFDSIHPTLAGHGDYARTVYEAITTRSLGPVA